MKYGIYRNLHNGKLSIKESKTGLVVGHADSVRILKANFRVSKAGVMKIREKKQKAVVATVHGLLSALEGFTAFKGRDITLTRALGKSAFTSSEDMKTVGFNPYKYTDFVDSKTEEPLRSAEQVFINNTGSMKAWGTKLSQEAS